MLSLETFKLDWDKQFPDVRLRRSHFLLAVSGGVDSIVLAHLMHSLQAKCTIAHVNFQLRGEESNRDEAFVRQFADQFNIPIQIHHADTAKYAEVYKMGIQVAAREIRYAWFGAIMKEITMLENSPKETTQLNALSPKPKPVVLLTAHHANDQAETVLMHLLRGTGLHGLTGIPIRRKDILNIARPLLNFTKDEIMTYAAVNGLKYVQDSSNEQDDYNRNFIRNKIMPQLAQLYPNAHQNIIATANRLKESEEILNNAIASFWRKGLKYSKGILSVSINHWRKVNNNFTYTWGLIKNYGFHPSQIEEMHKILSAKEGAYIESSTHQFMKWGDQIQIINKLDGVEYLVVDQPELFLNNEATTFSIKAKSGQLVFELIQNMDLASMEKEAHIAYLDAQKLAWPLVVRTWSPSDYFYPLGLGKKKKLNHFLSNFKLSPIQKQKVTVLCHHDQILWVIGMRIDDRFKIRPHTSQVLKITWQEIA